MTCRHGPGDLNCSANAHVLKRMTEAYNAEQAGVNNASNYSIVDAKRIEDHLILKVRYPSCKNCSFEGDKVMVFLNVSEIDSMRWKKTDPHFRESSNIPEEAPSPAARFPPTKEGWADAENYVHGKLKYDPNWLNKKDAK